MQKWAGEVAQGVEHLPNKHDFNLQNHHQKKKKKKKKQLHMSTNLFHNHKYHFIVISFCITNITS
jgi:hypothetical protein